MEPGFFVVSYDSQGMTLAKMARVVGFLEEHSCEIDAGLHEWPYSVQLPMAINTTPVMALRLRTSLPN